MAINLQFSALNVTHRNEAQKWELMEACLHNLRLWLDSLDPYAAAAAEPQKIPALTILFDLLGAVLRLLVPLRLSYMLASHAGITRPYSGAGCCLPFFPN